MINIKQVLFDVTVPVGSIIAFAGETQPLNVGSAAEKFKTQPESNGWMICDGRTLKSSEYPELYAAIGKLYTPSDNDTNFNLPDLRGLFVRSVGIDDSSTEDRTKAHGGTTNGIGSTQKDAFQKHQHQYNEPTGASPGDSGSAFAAIKPDAYTGPPTSKTSPTSIRTSSKETRSANIFLYHLIKYTYKLPAIQVDHPFQ